MSHTTARARSLYAVGVLAVLIGLVACGDDAESGSDGTTTTAVDTTETTAADSTDEPAGSPVRVLVIDESENSSAPKPEIIASALAAEAALADSTRPLEVIPCEVAAVDPADTGPALACVREAIETGVAAFVGTIPEDGSVLLEQAGIPQFPSTALTNFELTNPNSFLTSGGAQLVFAAQGIATVEQGGQRVAVVSFDIEAAASLVDLAKRAIEGSDGEVAAEVFVPFGAVDVSPQVQQIADSNADAVLIITTEDVAANVIRTIDQFGLDVAISFPADGLRQETLDALGPLADGLLGGAALPRVNIDGENAAVLDQYIEDMEATDSFTADLTRGSGVAVWVSMYAISLAAERVDGDVDGPALLEALAEPEPLTLPIVGDWVPSANGPLEDAPRISVGTGYLFAYAGNGVWETLPPEEGIDVFEVLAAGG